VVSRNQIIGLLSLLHRREATICLPVGALQFNVGEAETAGIMKQASKMATAG